MKNKQALYLLMTANIISGCAQGVTMLAIPWYFVDIMGMSSEFGIMYAMVTIASLFWSMYSGTLIDRYPRKILFQSITLVSFSLIGLTSLIGYYVGEVPMLLVGLVFGITMFNYQIHYPTLYAFGQEITEKENYAKMNSMLEVQGQVANIIAGGLGALLLSGINTETLSFLGFSNVAFEVAPWQIKDVFLLDASTYLVAFSIISFIKYTPISQGKIDTSNIVSRLKAGVSFLKNETILFHFGNASYSIFVFLIVELHLLLPLYVGNHMKEGAGVFALAELMYSIGALLAGVWIRKLIKETNYILAIIVLMGVCSGAIFWMALSNNLWLFILFNLVFGLTNAGVRIMRVTYLFNHIPNNIIGRVTSIYHMINVSLRFLLILIFSLSFFAVDNNVIYAYMISGAFIFVSIIPIVFLYRKLVK